jgi:hypothetical protein
MNRFADSLAKPRVTAAFLLPVMLAAALVSTLATAVADNALRCGTHVVSVGATAAEVADKCGEPGNVQQWEEGGDGYVSQLFDYETERYLAPRLIKAPVRMERWTYDFGSNKFIRYLTFQNGRLIKIMTGDKGDP